MEQISLFYGFTKEEQQQIQNLGCMRRQKFEKNQRILHMGDFIREIGLVLTGSIRIENVDVWGNKSILGHLAEGQTFAETYVFCEEMVMVDVVAAEPTEILFLHIKRLEQEGEMSTWQVKLLWKLLRMSSEKNLLLTSRLFNLSAKSVRGRLLTYLNEQAVKAGNTRFSIPFTRQQMADYLNLDRSALSKELCHMRDEGLLDFHKNTFRLFVKK